LLLPRDTPKSCQRNGPSSVFGKASRQKSANCTVHSTVTPNGTQTQLPDPVCSCRDAFPFWKIRDTFAADQVDPRGRQIQWPNVPHFLAVTPMYGFVLKKKSW
jgi:hypothetical protein